MAEEDEREALPDLRPTKIVWDNGGITVTAQQFADNGVEVGPYTKTVEVSDPRLSKENRDIIVAAMRVVAAIEMEIKPKPGGAAGEVILG